MRTHDFLSHILYNTQQVIVFSKSYCPFCTKTKSLFDTLGVEYKVYELDQMNDGPELQAALFELSNQRSVPNVFIKQKHIGGNDDTQKLAKTGKLNELLGI
jgi:glutaredoxin 3